MAAYFEELDREESGTREEKIRFNEYREPTYEKIDVLGRSRYVWQKRGEHYVLSLVDTALYCMSVEGGYTPIVMQFGTKRLLSDSVLPLGYAMGVCEDYARSIGADNYAVKDAEWRTDFATEKQIYLLRKNGVPFRPSITKGEAAELLSRVFNVGATEKQVWFIKNYGLHDNPELLTKREAMQIIRQYKEAAG